MPEPTLLIGIAFSVFNAGIYFHVGRTLSRRFVASPDARLAWKFFSIWWYALGATTLISGLLTILGSLGVHDLALFIALTQVNLLTICVALYGLLYYFLYLFTGNRRWLTPLTLFYILYYMVLVYYISWRGPVGIAVQRWNVSLEYAQYQSGPFFSIVWVLLVFPQIIGSLAYFTLFFRVKDPAQKYRIALVAWSIIIWFASAFLASVSGLEQFDWWQIISRLIGLGAALTILMAYQPPGWIQHRLGSTMAAEENA